MKFTQLSENRKNKLLEYLNENGIYKIGGDSRHLYEYPLIDLEREYAKIKERLAE